MRLSRFAALSTIVLTTLTSACLSRGYSPPAHSAAPAPTRAPWTVAVAAGPFDAAIPSGAAVGRHHAMIHPDNPLELLAQAGNIPVSAWVWDRNFSLEPSKLERASVEAMRDARWDVEERDAARFSLEGTIVALALDTWGEDGVATRAQARLSIDWRLRDLASGAIVASRNEGSTLNLHQVNVIETIVPQALRSAQYRFMAEPDVRAAIRKAAQPSTE